MLDVSPLFLWPLEELIEFLPLPTADSPKARRLSVLLAEARAAGTPAPAVFAVLLDRSRLLQASAGDQPAAVLAMAIAAADRIGRDDPSGTVVKELEEVRAAAAEPDHPVALCAERLAARAQGLLEAVDMTPADAWHDANDLFAALAALTGEHAEELIDQCAQLAYARLFPGGGR
jgi:hypothetical protein